MAKGNHFSCKTTSCCAASRERNAGQKPHNLPPRKLLTALFLGSMIFTTVSATAMAETSITPSALWSSLSRSLHITTGPQNYKRVIYVFFDPNCIYCHAFWEVADPVQKALHLDIRWVPVAFLKPNSMAKDAAILMAPNSAQAFEYNETHFHQSAEEGGIQGEATAPTGLIHAVLANNEMMETVLKNRGTPTIVYKIDGKIKVQRGLPSSQSAIYTILTGK